MKIQHKVQSVDEFGVQNYNGLFLAFVGVVTLYSIIALLSFLLLYFEQGGNDSNIQNYADAFWTLQMSASTIGFGDYFPVTFGGRIIVALMFYIGVGLVGFIGALIADRILGFANTNVRNRELRKQNEELLKHNITLEKKLDTLISHTSEILKNK